MASTTHTRSSVYSSEKTIEESDQEIADTTVEVGATFTPEWQSRHVWFIVSAIFSIAILKGIRLPNLWSTTQMLLNYHHGFIRRGLVGEILWLIGGDFFGHYYALVIVAYFILAVASCALAYTIFRFLGQQPQRYGPLLAVLVFAASPGFVWLLHEVGYFDYFGLIAILFIIHFSVLNPNKNHIFLVITAINILLAFAHESLVLMFTPAMCFVLICHITQQIEHSSSTMSRCKIQSLFAMAFLSVLVSFAASATIGIVGTRDSGFVTQLYHSLSSFADFPLRGDVLGLLSRPVKENLFSLMPNHWSVPQNRQYLVNGLIASAPSLIFLGYYGFCCINLATPVRWQKRLLKLNLVAAVTAPLTMNFLGWDCPRWNTVATLAVLSCIFAISLTRLQDKNGQVRAATLSSGGLSFGILALVLGLCTNYPNFLFDGYLVRWFPFDHIIDSLLEIFRSEFTFRPAA